MNNKQTKIMQDLNKIQCNTYGEQCAKEEKIIAMQVKIDAYNALVSVELG